MASHLPAPWISDGSDEGVWIVRGHALEPGFVVVQTGYCERPFPDQEWHMVRRRTYLLDRATGNGGLVSDNLPRIVWIGDSSFVGAWEPYSKVEVRALPSLQALTGS